MTAPSEVGVLIAGQPPARVAPVARLAEQLGFAEIWVAEDYFEAGGVAAAAIALGATDAIPVGLGVLSVVARHPALTAMELSTLASAFPGRLRAGLGLGLGVTVERMGLMPASPTEALRTSVRAVRSLLRGETVTTAAATFRLDAVALHHPPDEPVPVYVGALGPRMLEVAGEVGDGAIGSSLSSAAYVRFARERLAAGAGRAGRLTTTLDLPVFAVFHTGDDDTAAREAVRPLLAAYLSGVGPCPLTDAYGASDELARLLASVGADGLATALPDEWLDDLVIAGDAASCASKIRRLVEAGASRVVLLPMPGADPLELLRRAGAEVLPLLGSAP